MAETGEVPFALNEQLQPRAYPEKDIVLFHDSLDRNGELLFYTQGTEHYRATVTDLVRELLTGESDQDLVDHTIQKVSQLTAQVSYGDVRIPLRGESHSVGFRLLDNTVTGGIDYKNKLVVTLHPKGISNRGAVSQLRTAVRAVLEAEPESE